MSVPKSSKNGEALPSEREDEDEGFVGALRMGVRSVTSLRLWTSEPVSYKSACMIEEERYRETWSDSRKRLYMVVANPRFEGTVGLVIVLNVVLMLMEADANARAYPDQHSDDVIKWLNRLVLVIYTLEAVLRMYIFRYKYFRSKWNQLDLLIVLAGWLDEIYSTLLIDKSNKIPILDVLPMLRLLRILRLVRAVRLLRFHPELHILIMGFFGAMRAMLWGFALIMGLLIFWSVIFVELLHPVSREMKENDVTPSLNNFCQQAYSSVFYAGYMLFQTLVAGDSWGTCALPVIQYKAWTFFVFAIAGVTVTLGLMNLILGVIVDHAQSAREGSKEEKIQHKKEEENAALEEWRALLEQIDVDGDGRITYNEIMSGYNIPAVRDTLNLMGINRADLHSMFKLMDRDSSGDIDYTEFLDVFQKAHRQDMRIYLMKMQLEAHEVFRMTRNLAKDMQLVRGALGLDRAKAESPRHNPASGQAAASREAAERQGEEIRQPHDEAAAEVSKVMLGAQFRTLSASIDNQFMALSRSMEQHISKLERHTQVLEEAQLMPTAMPAAMPQVPLQQPSSELRGSTDSGGDGSASPQAQVTGGAHEGQQRFGSPQENPSTCAL